MVQYTMIWCSIARLVMTYSFISYYIRWCYVIGCYIRVCWTIWCHKIVPHNIIWCNKKYTTKPQRAESFDEKGPRPRGPWAHGLWAPIILSTSQPKPFSLALSHQAWCSWQDLEIWFWSCQCTWFDCKDEHVPSHQICVFKNSRMNSYTYYLIVQKIYLTLHRHNLVCSILWFHDITEMGHSAPEHDFNTIYNVI